MLKRLGIVLLVVAVLAAVVAGVVMAQDPTPEAEELCPFEEACEGPGTGCGAGGCGMGGYGMQGTFAGSMPSLLAEALGLTVDEFYAARAGGQTVADIAATQGIELADVVAAVLRPRADSLAQAVADGRITQEQADTMLATMADHMTASFQNGDRGYGGGCGMMGGAYGPSGRHGHHGGMMGGRWFGRQVPDSDT